MQNSKYEQELKNIGIEIDELKKIYSIDSINTEADFNILHEYNNEYYGYLYTKENTNVEEFILDVIWKSKTTLEMKINKEILNNTIKFLENVETYEKQKRLEKFSKQYNELEIISYDLPKLLNSDEYLTEHLNNICKEIKLATENEDIIDYYIKKIEAELKYKDAYLTFIEEVPEKIEKSIPKIKEQIKLYTYIISYIETYIEKNKQYQESANKALLKIKLSVEHENAKQILNMKIKNSKEIESIMKVELLKTYKKQLFHIDNINKLNIYKLILDLLGEEINNNIEIVSETNTLLKLINSIVKENITDIETNMKKLKRKNLSEEIIKKLESEIKEYKKRR